MSLFSFVLGTRPEIIKLAPLIRRVRDAGIPFQLVHTGQHYDYVLDGVFFEQLQLPKPTTQLKAAAATQAEFFAKAFVGLDTLWQTEAPSVVIVQGDTNSAFAGAFIASRRGIPVAHVEAGLRSDDWTMPEEQNRVMIDRLATRLYIPTEEQMDRLFSEGIDTKSCVLAGNTIVDAVDEHLPIAEKTILPDSLLKESQSPFALITLHRPALVDHRERLLTILESIDIALTQQKIRGIFLIHPRTLTMLGTPPELASILLHEPIGYLQMLHLLTKAKLVLTDSGGLQEETALLHIPCITLRDTTERPETVRAGGNRIVGFDVGLLQSTVRDFLTQPPTFLPLYNVAHPSNLILSDLRTHFL